MRVQTVREGYKFTVMILGYKREYLTRTLEEGQDIALILLGGVR